MTQGGATGRQQRTIMTPTCAPASASSIDAADRSGILFFILVNSISGIGGLLTKGTFELPWVEAIGLIVAVFVGGQIGIRLSLSKLTGNGIKVVTAILVLVVGIRVLLINGLQFEF